MLSSWALPFLFQLAEQCGETSNLAVLEDDHVIYVAQAPGRHRMRMFTEVGRRVLPHSTAVGKVLLAWQDDDHVRRVVTRFGLPPRTANTLTTLADFREELMAVRERGWALDDEEEELGGALYGRPGGTGGGRGGRGVGGGPRQPAGSWPGRRRGRPAPGRRRARAQPRRRARLNLRQARPIVSAQRKHVSGWRADT